MRRWLLAFLIVLLPLQFASAAAAVYCAHERDSTPKHLGHHVEDGSAAKASVSADPEQGKASASVDHSGCAYAHLGCAVHPVTGLDHQVHRVAEAEPPDSSARFRSRPGTVLERPQWAPLA